MKRIDWSALDAAGKNSALARPVRRTAGDLTDVVRAILDDVGQRGGAAVTEWCVKLDKSPPRRIAITPGAIAEARDAVEDVIEPYLLQQGLIMRTPRGRMLGQLGWRHLGLDQPKAAQAGLFDG